MHMLVNKRQLSHVEEKEHSVTVNRLSRRIALHCYRHMLTYTHCLACIHT